MKLILPFTVLSTLLLSSVTLAKIQQDKDYGAWKGVCQDGICGVVQTVSNKENVPVGRIVIRRVEQANNEPVAFVTVPLGVNLRAGMGIAVDGKQISAVPFDFCDPDGCNVALPLKGEAESKFKSGSKLQIAAFVGKDQQTLEFSLKGISAALSEL